MATSLKESEKEVWIEKKSRRCLSYGEKIVKIGQVDPEKKIWLKLKKKKLTQAKYIAHLASLPSGLNNRDSPSRALPWRNFSKSTVVQAKMGHVSPTTPFWG